MAPRKADAYVEAWKAMWDAELEQAVDDDSYGQGQYLPDEFYVSGRASQAYPDKEDARWWSDKGPGFVSSWVIWRDNCGMDFWVTPQGEPAIELEVIANRGDLEVLSIIDRVFIDADDELRIVDLKSGSMTPAWPRQLALNNLGLIQQFGVSAKWGGFWSARKGAVEWMDLRIYDEDWMWDQVRMAREIRDQQLFVAQPTMLCKSSCSVRSYCKAVGGELSLLTPRNTDTRE